MNLYSTELIVSDIRRPSLSTSTTCPFRHTAMSLPLEGFGSGGSLGSLSGGGSSGASRGLLLACFQELRERGLHSVGLFRQPCSVTELRALWAELRREGDEADEEQGLHKLKEVEDPHLIAGLVIWHLRQQAEPLFPFALYDGVLAAGGYAVSHIGASSASPDRFRLDSKQSDWSDDGSNHGEGRALVEVRFSDLRGLVARLPNASWEILSPLLEFLGEVKAMSSLNEMTAEALARVFGPVLCRPSGSAFMSLRHIQDIHKIQAVVLSLIENHASLLDAGCAGGEGARGVLSTPMGRKGSVTSDAGSGGSSGRRHSTADLSVVHRLVMDTVAMLFYDISDDEEKGGESKDHGGGGITRSKLLRLQEFVEPAAPRAGFFEGHDEDEGKDGLEHNTSPTGLSYLGFDGEAPVCSAQERRRMIAACRALRAQISHYEEAFSQEMGHLPKGRERAPMASTYAQYKLWKRTIRDDAVTQIQALVRRFLVNCRIPRRRRAPLPAAAATAASFSAAPVPTGAAPASATPPIPIAAVRRGSQGSTTEAMGGGNRTAGALALLMEEKRRIKSTLKDFDTSFMEEHGRVPTKADKEPMRSLYDQYNGIKRRIQEFEAALGAVSPGDIPVFAAVSSPPVAGSGLTAAADGSANASSSKAVGDEDPVSRLERLKRDKRALHVMLKKYEQDFRRAHGREVSSRADIAPVEAEYQRYKEIKRRLSNMQG
jgi:hypothetical protein